MNNSKKLVTILGPTAVGKTKFASKLAYKFNGEIISADSRQVYIGMDIGTGKDYEDYVVHNKKIKAHLIDVVKPHCEFNLYLFMQLFKNAFSEIIEKNSLPFLVGGTGLYLSSIIQKYQLTAVDFNSERALELSEKSTPELVELLKSTSPKLHNTTDLIEKKRIIKAILIAEKSNNELPKEDEINFLIIGLYDEREIVKNRIRERLKKRLEEGMIEEVKSLLESGITHQKLRFFGLEYKFISMYLSGEINYNDMYQKLASSIIQFSKRQMTWFRKMEKEGIEINWLKNNEMDKAEDMISIFLN